MQMPGRTFAISGGHRYGFNGKENDNEVKGLGNQYDFGERVFDSRIGRWLSLDPKQFIYPNLTPYNAMGNNPIIFIDPDGGTIIINAQNQADLLKTVGAISVIAGSSNGLKTVTSLHESNKKFVIKAVKGAKNEYRPSSKPGGDNVLTWDPNNEISHKKTYVTGSFFTLAHEMDHMYGTEKNIFSSIGESEAAGVNAENYQRSVHGWKGMREDYNFDWFDNWWNNATEDFKLRLDDNANPKGERIKITDQKNLSPIKTDSESTYTIQTVGTYSADAPEIKNATEGVVTYFDYQKDKDSPVEKKATLVIVHYANSEKK